MVSHSIRDEGAQVFAGAPISGRIGRQGLARETVASAQDIVDLVPTPVAMPGRIARPECPLHFQTRRFASPLQGACETPRLTRQIVERRLKRFEPAPDAGGVFQVVGLRGFWRATEVYRANVTVTEKRDARLLVGGFRPANKTQTGIEKLEGEARLRFAGADDVDGMGLTGVAFALMLREMKKTSRRTADSAESSTRLTVRCTLRAIRCGAMLVDAPSPSSANSPATMRARAVRSVEMVAGRGKRISF